MKKVRANFFHQVDQFCKVVSGELFQEGELDSFNELHFDSRLIEPGMGFLAMEGENTDGNEYISQAVKSGARLVISAKPMPQTLDPAVGYIQVECPLLALQKYAAWHRQKSKHTLFFGVTGSFGKTTTKDCLKGLLGKKCIASTGNYNNFLGMSLCLLKVRPEHEYAVMEMGISTPGEMGLLARILEPDHMVLTGLGHSHGEFFAAREDLIKEKLTSAKFLKDEGRLFLPESLLELVKLHFESPAKIRSLKTSLPCDDLERFADSLPVGTGSSFRLAASVAIELELAPQILLERLTEISFSPMRMERKSVSGVDFLLDCYNASPESMKAFLESLPKRNDAVLVVADMLELGERSQNEHRKVLELMQNISFGVGYLIGAEFHKAFDSVADDRLHCIQSKDEVLKEFQSRAPSFIALKGSRAFRLESLFEDYQRILC